MSITVVNKKLGGRGEYIGRPSLLGNPFVMRSESERERVVRQYEQWLRAQIQRRNPAVCGELNRLYHIAMSGDLNLVCWCAPRACHGDVVKKVLEEKLVVCKGR